MVQASFLFHVCFFGPFVNPWMRFQTYRKPGGEHFKIFFGCQAILGIWDPTEDESLQIPPEKKKRPSSTWFSNHKGHKKRPKLGKPLGQTHHKGIMLKNASHMMATRGKLSELPQPQTFQTFHVPSHGKHVDVSAERRYVFSLNK